MPVVETTPPGVARPTACVSWSNPPQVTPPWARAVRAPRSTHTPFMGDRSITMPPSQVPLPAALCAPPRTAVSRWCSRAKFTAATTSVAPVQRATSAGRLSAIAFHTLRAAS